MKYVKSPLNYTGGKFKLLPKIIPYIPTNTRTFVDLFAGGGNVGVNMVGKSDNVILNELLTPVTDVFEGIRDTGVDDGLSLIYEKIDKYQLSKTNKDGFLSIREDYNNGSKDWVTFYTMLMYSFNYQIRFNKNGDYNMPFGKDRSSFNKNTEKNFKEFGNILTHESVDISNLDFRDFDYTSLGEFDFVYVDPPYLITTASYNESGGWTEQHELELLRILSQLDKQGCKWMLSNVTEHKGKFNKELIEWSKRYNLTDVKHNYNNSSYHGKNTHKPTREVIITNYKLED